MSVRSVLLWQVLVPAIVGVLTGTCVAGLVWGVQTSLTNSVLSLPGVVPAFFAPLALVLTWLASKYVTRAEKPSTSELYITLYHTPGARLPREQLPGRLLATTATVGLGGAQGFESTSALVGTAWSDTAMRAAPGLSADARRSLLAAGASAGIAAVFSSPAAGALYGVEVPFKRDVDAPRLVPCVVAAVCSFAMRSWLIGEHRIVEVHGMPGLDAIFLLAAGLVAMLCGLGARLFAIIEEALRVFGKRRSRLQRALEGGTILTLLAIAGWWLCGSWITFGPGYIATGWMQAAPRALTLVLLALAVRAAANLVTVYGGGGGGVFTSLACNGAFIGEAVALALGCDTTHSLALIGAVSFLAAGYHLPIAGMLFLAEAGLGPSITGVGLLAVVLAFSLMGSKSVSDAQVDHREPACP